MDIHDEEEAVKIAADAMRSIGENMVDAMNSVIDSFHRLADAIGPAMMEYIARKERHRRRYSRMMERRNKE